MTARPPRLEEVAPGDALPPISLPITGASPSLDLLVCGFVDRWVTDWASGEAFIRRRRLVMSRPVRAGETVVADGRVLDARRADGRPLVDLEVVVRSEHGPCADALLTVELAEPLG